ncbi:DDE-type integrase/transposase/recombinase [Streptomyces tropicalis]|uniref:DDE-type integrase/transposase/recombinase n=1 Tax=Streptomyces tropicalis TaxID=3034234 RepID=UPI0034D95341
MDAFSRRILGWKAARNKHTALVLDVVEQALWQRGCRKKQQVNGGLIHHSDAGSQYTSSCSPSAWPRQASRPRSEPSPTHTTMPSPSPPSACSRPS